MGKAMDKRDTTVTGIRPVNPDLPDYPTILHALEDSVGRAPDRIAVSDAAAAITYAQYGRAVAGLARWLEHLGVAGGRVASLMVNSAAQLVTGLGAMAARAQYVPMNFGFPPKALAPLAADVSPAVLICDALFEELATAVAAEAGIPHVAVWGRDGLDLALWIDNSSLRLPEPKPGPDDPSVLFFTGGTTGVPKGAGHRHRNDMAWCRIAGTSWWLDQDREVMLNVAPNFHTWGTSQSMIIAPYRGATLIYLPEFKPETVLERMERDRVTVFAGGPAALYIGLRAHPNYKTTDFSALKHGFAGGSPCPEPLLVGWEAETGSPILEGWGMSEGAPINLHGVGDRRKLLSTGPACALTEIEVVDLETGTQVLSAGERGEVRVRGPQFIDGYLNRPEETAIAFRDGWLYTGDIGFIDDDGYMFLVDRKKEMIIVGGYNVYPREIDDLLIQHPAIQEVACIGIPDDFRGETVKACIARAPGAALSAEAVIAHCRDHLVKYKVPTAVEFFDSLPKTGAGKIDKLALKRKG
jgi:long-chain acyl-CoA synthetase